MKNMETELTRTVEWVEMIVEDAIVRDDNKREGARQTFAWEWIKKSPSMNIDTLPQLILLKEAKREIIRGGVDSYHFDSTTMLALDALRELPDILETADGFILPGQLAIAVEHISPMYMEVRLQNLAKQSIEASRIFLQYS